MKHYESAVDAAVAYVSRRERTEGEVRAKLAEYGFSEKEINAALKELKNSLLLNDEEYAREFVKTKLVTPHSLRVIRLKLLQHKISEELADKVLSDMDTDFENAYRESFSFYHNALRGEYDIRKLREKLYRRLISHGYSYDTAKNAMDKAENELLQE